MITIAALYKFTRFEAPDRLRAPLLAACEDAGIKGTILLAHEGINGTIAGGAERIGAVLDHIRTLPGCVDADIKFSHAETMPFFRMKVRVKPEIVTLRAPEADPTRRGDYVEAKDWNALVDDPDVILIDTRNDYEVAIGSFPGAINPQTERFADLPAWAAAFKTGLPEGSAKPRLAMFCTGGIRCEKSTALMRAHGFDDVVHLRGGILKYLEEVPAAESRWEGECFVFDQRVSVAHGVAPGSYTSCHACRTPLSRTDIEAPGFVLGASCPHCHDARDDAQRARYAERQKQMELADAIGNAHIGVRVRS